MPSGAVAANEQNQFLIKQPRWAARLKCIMDPNQITGRLIGRNWILNLAGQAAPLLIGLLTIPLLLRSLGVESFGILSIIWAVLGYAGQFDFGLGRATTKYVAECVGRNDSGNLPGLFWTSLLSQVVFGVLAAGMLAAITPTLTQRVLNISPVRAAEMESVLLILACSLPLVIASNSLRGTLEALQQFAVINYVKVPANASVVLLPLAGIFFGLRLPGIVILLVVARLLTGLVYLIFCFKFVPSLRGRLAFDAKFIRPLFSYGGWVTISNLIGPLLTYVDRFFVGSILSMSAVGYYAVPYEIAIRVCLVPQSLLATVFPAFSSLQARKSQTQLEDLYVRSLKSILLLSGPVLLTIASFAREILSVWLGPDFAVTSASTLQILALGVLINSISFVPFGLLQGLGRPDLTAKFHFLELPFYFLTLWFLLVRFGLPGAAWAWTLRIVLDTVLLFGAVVKLKLVSARAPLYRPLQRALVALGLPAVLLPLSGIKMPLGLQAALTGLTLLGFVAVVWGYALDNSERNLLRAAAVNFRDRLAVAK